MNSLLLKLLVGVHSPMQREEGQSMVEYALIVALIAFGATIAMQSLGAGLNSAFTNISSTLASSLT
ncbi:MAG TPA: Flp family type IVb pilin [Terracidiphilus sp.]|nr:Flp family type IVb pilin [Terracidiphilus sp.]